MLEHLLPGSRSFTISSSSGVGDTSNLRLQERGCLSPVREQSYTPTDRLGFRRHHQVTPADHLYAVRTLTCWKSSCYT